VRVYKRIWHNRKGKLKIKEKSLASVANLRNMFALIASAKSLLSCVLRIKMIKICIVTKIA